MPIQFVSTYVGFAVIRAFRVTMALGCVATAILAWYIFGSSNVDPEVAESEAAISTGQAHQLPPHPLPSTTSSIPELQVNRPFNNYFDQPLPDLSQTYAQHMIKARSGDVNSQYILYRILTYCRGVEPITGTSLSDIRSIRDENLKLQLRAKSERCSALVTSVSDPVQQATDLYTTLYNADHPLVVIMTDGRQSRDIQREHIVKALEIKLGHPFLESEAFLRASKWYGELSDYESTTRSWAWQTLYCKARPDCNLQEYLAHLWRTVHPHQYDQISLTVRAYEKALSIGDIDALEF